MNKTIYFILAGLLAVYIFNIMTSKKKSRKRGDRKFMDDYKRKDKDSKQ